jgi:hypothetical protein
MRIANMTGCNGCWGLYAFGGHLFIRWGKRLPSLGWFYFELSKAHMDPFFKVRLG